MQLYISRARKNHPHAKRKTVSALVGRVQSNIKHAFQSSAKESALRRIPLEVLISIPVEAFLCNMHKASIDDAKAVLRKLAEDEHRPCRMACTVRRAGERNIEDPNAEKLVDKLILNQCERLCFE